MPAGVQVGPTYYTIHCDELALLALRGLLGQAHEREQSIEIDPHQGPDMLAETLFHEVLHCVLFPVGLDDHVDEKVVRVICSSLFDTMRRNPALMEALLK